MIIIKYKMNYSYNSVTYIITELVILDRITLIQARLVEDQPTLQQ